MEADLEEFLKRAHKVLSGKNKNLILEKEDLSKYTLAISLLLNKQAELLEKMGEDKTDIEITSIKGGSF